MVGQQNHQRRAQTLPLLCLAPELSAIRMAGDVRSSNRAAPPLSSPFFKLALGAFRHTANERRLDQRYTVAGNSSPRVRRENLNGSALLCCTLTGCGGADHIHYCTE